MRTSTQEMTITEDEDEDELSMGEEQSDTEADDGGLGIMMMRSSIRSVKRNLTKARDNE